MYVSITPKLSPLRKEGGAPEFEVQILAPRRKRCQHASDLASGGARLVNRLDSKPVTPLSASEFKQDRSILIDP